MKYIKNIVRLVPILIFILIHIQFCVGDFEWDNPRDKEGTNYGMTNSIGCVDECSSGKKQCSGDGYQECGNYDSDDCLEWSSVTNCGSGETCSNGVCSAPEFCTNECTTEDSRQCSGDGYQVCGDYDSDECLEWSSVTNCGSGETCSNGECSPISCTDDCNVEGERQCSGDGYRTCGNYDSDSCLEWSSVTNCSSGEICSEGICILHSPKCPGNEIVDMGTYYIDKYEASRPDATQYDVGSDDSEACTRADVLPWVNIYWNVASEACAARGGGWGLCSANEWGDACDGTIGQGGYIYPYGDTYDEGSTCNGGESGHASPASTGSSPGCISKDGVYDMSGNVAEWTGEIGGNYHIVRGGGYGSLNDELKCYYRGNEVRYDEYYVGFRCCKDK